MATEHIEELSFSNVIGDRFGRYSKYIIQDRALPDIRDGLKPVQRRILFAMYQDRNTADNPYRKSAKTVGNVIGNYHPHGDTSVYNAMVRMSQDWKNRIPLIDMHGNNGSMDGDPAAAMRYTEARLAPISSELLADIDYDTVEHGLNFDDTLEEPLVLPAKFPNLLVNGATGISAGYATDIPPHNLGEVIDAIIYKIEHDDATLKDLLRFVKGPDFPTGGIIQGADALKDIYTTGQGKLVVRAKTSIETLRGNKSQIVATELPYEVNKAKLIQKLDEIRIQGKIDGISEVRDESDRSGVRLVIELKRDIDAEGILNYLFKNTELQTNYHFNMVAIDQLRPVLVGLERILAAYIEHRQEVITRRTRYLLEADERRLHIVDGLIRLVSILDEVILTIRSSENRSDAQRNLQEQYDFSQVQAESIVSLQLYRLTNTDVVKLQEERLALNERIQMYEMILKSEAALNKVIVQELKEVQKKYSTPRLTQVEEAIEEINIDTSLLIPEEEVVVTVSKEGYIKRSSIRSYQSSQAHDVGVRDLDYILYVESLSTHDAIILFTNLGNYIHLPVYEIPEARWKDLGTHISQQYLLEDGEQVIAVYQAFLGLDEQPSQLDADMHLVLTTKYGMIKRTPLADFVTYRSYRTRTAQAMKFKHEGDELISVALSRQAEAEQIVLLTHRSYSLRYALSDVSTYGPKAQGVVAMNLKDDDYIAAANLIASPSRQTSLLALSQRGYLKHFALEVIAEASRGSRGTLLYKQLKKNPHRVLKALPVQTPDLPVCILGDTGATQRLEPGALKLTERLTNGSEVPGLADLGQVLDMYVDQIELFEQAHQSDSQE